MMALRIMVMAGGTGGHVFPALAVAERLREQGVDVVWLGTRKGLEADVVPRAGFPMEWISVAGLRGKGWLSWLLAPFRLVQALLQALLIMMRCRPMAVLGMGGFVSGPGGVMTWMLHKPLLIHEQNAVAGLTNRLLARLARTAMEAFPASLPRRCHPLQTGNPVRIEMTRLPPPEERFRSRTGPLRLLVLGGSLGASALNEIIPLALQRLPVEFPVQVRHQAGRHHISSARDAYTDAGLPARIEAFIDDMASAYAWADLVICRAGAMTVAELSAVGVASILVPYPFAVDDHQTANARYLADAGAACLLPQHQLQPPRLARLIESLCLEEGADGIDAPAIQKPVVDDIHRQRLCMMACAARRLAMPEATDKVATACMEAAYG